MELLKKILFSFIVLTVALGASSQIVEPVKWTFSQTKLSEAEYDLHLTARIDKGWHLYGTELPDGGAS